VTRRRLALPRLVLSLAPPAVLAGENLAIFFRHYFRGWGFPWDFVGSYYAATAYWTEAVARRALAEWMPFQSMGYPFRLDLQTGLWYPPLWVFPILRMPYTLQAAVTVQALHVLLGALGMYVLLRMVLRSRLEALAGAFVFQLFGGFYSNAEHVDIVRAYALTPWLLAALVPARRDEPAVPRRVLALALAVWAMAVGGYPGNLISSLFLAAVFVAAVLAARRDRATLRWAAASAAAVALGLAMSAAQLGPAWIHRSELERHQTASTVDRASLGVPHLAGLVEDVRGAPEDRSMTLTFVGFVAVCGLCFLDGRALRGRSPWTVLLAVSSLMAAGDRAPLHPLLRRLAPPLAYSRFPSSDYRGDAAVLLILFAAAGWQALRRRPGSGSAFVLRLLPAAAFSAWAVWSCERRVPLAGAVAEAVRAFVLAAAVLFLWRRVRGGLARVGVAVMLLGVASFDASRVLSRLDTWAVPNLIETCRLYEPTLARLADAGLVVRPEVFAVRRGPRPARTLGEAGYRASGYLTGEFDLADFGGPVLQARTAAVTDPVSLVYGSREWRPVVLDPPPPPGSGAVEIPGLRPRIAAAAPDPRVAQRAYGSDEIVYRVRLERPALLVENEIFFPGWTGLVRRSGAASGSDSDSVQAVRVNGIWRGWPLPAGDYELVARFRLPGARALTLLAAAAWLAWTAWLLVAFRPVWRSLRAPVRV
jgi:hypothetical protein